MAVLKNKFSLVIQPGKKVIMQIDYLPFSYDTLFLRKFDKSK
ncbi:hypothetical protein SAMN04488023_103142 [Pedobacter rhizosphaerae]|uniref:Uncharacterized protein n=1 Tax=Pedobacter rhizosphaerae TaxID=390241 RepID=A0A1H9KTI8_9SPHI|nr:hypothetical protein SAMN04488023_103142 [Pedobacter rhizosphaerae]